MTSFLDSESKPKDWPVNDRETKLEAVFKAVEKFRDEPSYKTREVMLALINEHDLNQRSYRGMIRVGIMIHFKMTKLITVQFVILKGLKEFILGNKR